MAWKRFLNTILGCVEENESQNCYVTVQPETIRTPVNSKGSSAHTQIIWE